MSSLLSFPVIISALELGFIYALVALALFLSYSILNIADLSTDGCFTLGCAVGAQVAIMGHPILALFAAMAAGVCSGFIMASLQTKLGVEPILAGIIVNTGLYTVNLAVMGFSSNLSIFKTDTIYSLFKDLLGSDWYRLVVSIIIVVIVCVLLAWFLGTRMGLSIRATGDNEDMVRASSIHADRMKLVALSFANGLVGLSGAVYSHYMGYADVTAGSGTVVSGFASVIIGEAVVGFVLAVIGLFHRDIKNVKGSVTTGFIAAVIGSVSYRVIVALAINTDILPSHFLKLITVAIIIIALAIGPTRDWLAAASNRRRRERENA